jgi:hypothetical protein
MLDYKVLGLYEIFSSYTEMCGYLMLLMAYLEIDDLLSTKKKLLERKIKLSRYY